MSNKPIINKFNGWAGFDGRGGYHGRGGHGGDQIDLGLRTKSSLVTKERSNSYNYILEKIKKQSEHKTEPSNPAALQELMDLNRARCTSSSSQNRSYSKTVFER